MMRNSMICNAEAQRIATGYEVILSVEGKKLTRFEATLNEALKEIVSIKEMLASRLDMDVRMHFKIRGSGN